jgi:hypothetical protein
VALPRHDQLYDVVLSPAGDRVAWEMQVSYVPPLLAELHRLMPAFKVRPKVLVSLWISKSDGTAMHEIARTEEQADPSDWARKIHDIHWLPDEKSLSFTYDNALWTVPAD